MKNYKAAELVEVLFAKIGNNQNSNQKNIIHLQVFDSLSSMTNREREREKEILHMGRRSSNID